MPTKVNKNMELENRILREALSEIERKMDATNNAKPKACKYCKYFVQHYIKGGYPAYTKEYLEIDEGHCARRVKTKAGGRRNPKPDDTCSYFEIGTQKMRMCL